MSSVAISTEDVRDKAPVRLVREGDAGYQRCTECIMDTTDPEIRFDAEGRCSHCRMMDDVRQHWRPEGDPAALKAMLDRIRADGRGREYDVAVGLSGGVDSSWLACLARQWGLRTLLVHVDTGWNSELAIRNIENLVVRLGFDLETHVVDWEEMQDLQSAFLRAGVPNQDVPQDHAIFAAFYRLALGHGVKWAFSGHNYACEAILPKAWGCDPMDVVHLRDIHRRFGRRPLRSFPLLSHVRRRLHLQVLKGLEIAQPLNLIAYDKEQTVRMLGEQVGWRTYGCKHYESRFTKFFQGWYLPTKWGYDKRLAHLSSLIVSGQISREAALAEFRNGKLLDYEIEDEQDFVRRKLDLSPDEFRALMEVPPTPHSAYRRTSEHFMRLAVALKRILYGLFRGRPT